MLLKFTGLDVGHCLIHEVEQIFVFHLYIRKWAKESIFTDWFKIVFLSKTTINQRALQTSLPSVASSARN